MASARSSTRSTSVRAAARDFDVVAAAERGLAQLLAQHGRVDAQLLRGVGGKLVAGQLLRHAADVRQQEVHGLHLLLRAGAGKQLPRALDQVVGLAARAAHGRRVGLDAALADEAVGVEAAVEGDDLDGEALLGEQGDGLFRGIGAGGVGIEVDDDLRGVAPQNRHLLLGEGRSAGGDHVLNAAQKDRDAVHLALDQQGKLKLADGGARLVEIEEDLALGVERRLRRVDVLGAGLFAGFERARGEGDHAAALVGDGKHDPLAEAVVDGRPGCRRPAPWS